MPVIPVSYKVAFVLLAIGLIVFLIGFGTPYWYYRDIPRQPYSFSRNNRQYMEGEEHMGLWRYCHDIKVWFGARPHTKTHIQNCGNLLGTAGQRLIGELRATQFFETAGFLAILPAILLLVLGVCIESCKDRRILPILSAVCCLASAGCIIIGSIIFGSYAFYKDYLSWSFAVTIVGGILFGVSGVLIIVGAILKK